MTFQSLEQNHLPCPYHASPSRITLITIFDKTKLFILRTDRNFNLISISEPSYRMKEFSKL